MKANDHFIAALAFGVLSIRHRSDTVEGFAFFMLWAVHARLCFLRLRDWANGK